MLTLGGSRSCGQTLHEDLNTSMMARDKLGIPGLPGYAFSDPKKFKTGGHATLPGYNTANLITRTSLWLDRAPKKRKFGIM